MPPIKPFTILLLTLALGGLLSCDYLTGKKKPEPDPRFSQEKKSLVEYEAEISSLKVRKATTYLFDCQSANPRVENTIIEEREFDRDGRMTKRTEYHYSGVQKSSTSYFFGPDGNKTYQNLYNARNAVVQTKYFDKFGYDTLTRNFIEDGSLRNEMNKLITRNPDGYPVKLEEIDHLQRTHTLATFSYNNNVLAEETFTRFNVVSGDEVATEVIQYNEQGDRAYMATSTSAIIEDEVSMSYVYNEDGKIASARLLDKYGLLMRDKVNTFYDNGEPRSIVDIYLDPSTADTIQVYEENYNESGKMLSFFMKEPSGRIKQSGEYTYDKIKLEEAIEFDPSQSPPYVCTFIDYDFYN